jgi:hypothetical protein
MACAHARRPHVAVNRATAGTVASARWNAAWRHLGGASPARPGRRPCICIERHADRSPRRAISCADVRSLRRGAQQRRAGRTDRRDTEGRYRRGSRTRANRTIRLDSWSRWYAPTAAIVVTLETSGLNTRVQLKNPCQASLHAMDAVNQLRR